MGAAQSLQTLATTEAAVAVLHPLRLRLLQALAEPDSATGLARKLGLPRQQLNYHLHELEKAGLLREVEKRVKGNCIERIVQATARYYVVAPSTLGGLGPTPETLQDQFSSAYLVAAASRAIDDLHWLRQQADAAGKTIATLTLESDVRFADPAARKAFTDEITAAFSCIAAKYHDAEAKGGRAFRVMLGAWPQTPKDRT